MSSWRIFSDTGNDYRWQISGPVSNTEPYNDSSGASIQPLDATSRLPSMVDLLRQGCSKLLEDRDEDAGNTPMFRTGLGKSVVLKRSSIAKALSVIGDDVETHTEEAYVKDDGCGFSNSLFHTASGKLVNISSDGLVRAKTLLGLEDNNYHCNFEGGVQHSRKLFTPNVQNGWRSVSHLEMKEGVNNGAIVDTASVSAPLISEPGLAESKSNSEVSSNLMKSEMFNLAPKPPPITFHTAGGRSLSVSSEALQRAKSILGDPELGTFLNEGNEDDPVHSYSKRRSYNDASLNKENEFQTSFFYQGMAGNKHMPKSFISPLRSSLKQVRPSVNSENIISASNLIEKFDAADDKKICGLNSNAYSTKKPSSSGPCSPKTVIGNSSNANPLGRLSHGRLVDISNSIGTAYANNKQTASEKRRLGRTISISPFKRPRSSKFCTPLKGNVSFVSNGLSSDSSCCKKRVSTRYPFQIPRMYVKEYFGSQLSHITMLEHLSDQVRGIKSDNADKYKFCDESGLNCFGAEAFLHMLVQCGASVQHASKEWVTNHYKWIVWKLACYERCYPAKSKTKFLTVSNVLDELKYRYEREVNHGQRSAIKRILEGDASPSSMLVLCISSIYTNCQPSSKNHLVALNGAENSNSAKVELTDGWYSMDAILDASLLKQLAAGKLSVGQKLRICGAGLSGWVGPVSPLEASKSVSFILHINGTYRAHWGDRLGFCKGVGIPLAFRCIKSDGGPVPQTLVGVTRVYPVLYKERLSNGGSIVRSERMETKMMQVYSQRRSVIVEGIVSEFQRAAQGSHIYSDTDGEEGAKILKILETAAEPEVLMAEMSPEQLTSFASYQAKLEATRQLDLEKSIEKALKDAGLEEREISPFMRVRVVGLISKSYRGKGSPKEGLITIWNPTQKQQAELVEGQAYAIAGLVPVNYDSNTLYLQARGSTTKWEPLSPLAIEHFDPRKSVSLSNLGEVPLSSEFDIAAFVVHVGEVYTAAHQKRQWVFVTDGSISELQLEELSDSLLAISFCLPYIDDDSFAPINCNLAGSTAGFCNLIKKAKDQVNHIWIAEATENSNYSFAIDPHLKHAASSAQKWAKTSSSAIDKLKEKVLFIIGDCKD